MCPSHAPGFFPFFPTLVLFFSSSLFLCPTFARSYRFPYITLRLITTLCPFLQPDQHLQTWNLQPILPVTDPALSEMSVDHLRLLPPRSLGQVSVKNFPKHVCEMVGQS